jgi:response regulator RpfG family c-di-GMP phosphodiesterase
MTNGRVVEINHATQATAIQPLEGDPPSRLFGLLESAEGWSDAFALLDDLGERIHAEALFIEEPRTDAAGPLASYICPRLRRDDVLGALPMFVQGLPSPLDHPYPVHWSELLAHSVPAVMALLAKDSWVERLAISAGNALLGTLTVVGARSRGCPPLITAERHVLRLVSYPVLLLAREQRRVQRLESDLRFMGTLSQGLAARTSTLERLKRAVRAIQEETGFESVQVVTWNPHHDAMLLNVLYLRDAGFVPDHTWDRMSRSEIRASSEEFLNDPSPRVIANPAELPMTPPAHRRWMRAQGISFIVFVPLLFAESHLGTVILTSRFSRESTEERLQSVTTLGGHIAAILQLALLLTQVQDAYSRLRASHRSTVEMLALAAEMRDATTGRHLKHLRELSTAIARHLDLPEADIEDLAYAAAVHDIGKLEIPDAVLLKPGPLTTEEWCIVKNHTTAGEQLLLGSDVPQVVRDVVRWHHERWDGNGYPDRLVGDEIPLGVQIVSVADAFDALTSQRPYKEPWPIDRALEEIRRGIGTQFSPLAVDALLSIVDTLPAAEELNAA